MKKMTRFLAVMLVMTLVLALLPAAAMAADKQEQLQWAVEGGELWISVKGALLPEGGETPWVRYRKEITAVRMDYGVTEIGEGAFSGCTGLKSVNLPASVRMIHKDAFRDCGKLCWITLPEKLEYIGEGAFAGCTGLKSVFIPDRVGGIGAGAFAETVVVNAVSGSAAEAFAKENGCAFTSIGIHQPMSGQGKWRGIHWNLESGILTISGKGEVLPENESRYPWESGRNDITALVVEDGITAIGAGAFRDCRNLQDVTLEESVTAIGDCAFAGCTGLEELTLPECLEKIGAEAFPKTTMLICAEDSVAALYAEANALSFRIEETDTPEADEVEMQPEVSAAEPESAEQPQETAAEEIPEATENAVPETTEPAPEEETEAPAAEEPEEAEETAEPEETEEVTAFAAENEEAPETTTEPAAEASESTGETEPLAETEPTEAAPAAGAESADQVAAENLEVSVMDLIITGADAIPGDRVKLVLALERNPGIAGLQFALEYDSKVMTLVDAEACIQAGDWTMDLDGGKFLWASPEAWTEDSDMLILEFQVAEDAPEGEYLVGAEAMSAADGEEHLLPAIGCYPGHIRLGEAVMDAIPGDVNNDGRVTALDSLLLKAWIVGLNNSIAMANADVNGDGNVDLRDAIRLDRMLLGMEKNG